MDSPHIKRRSRWLEQSEILEFQDEVWIPESYVYTLMDRELAFERRRCAELLCPHCKDAKPSRDRGTNTFMHEIYIQETPQTRILQRVVCYADVLWRNEDQ